LAFLTEEVMVEAVLLDVVLAFVFALVGWAAAKCANILRSRDWRRAAGLLLFLFIIFGAFVVQIWLLTVMISASFSRTNAIYFLAADGLLFWVSLIGTGMHDSRKEKLLLSDESERRVGSSNLKSEGAGGQ
jgi:predicted membrane channel-forming protein YqfA (hemolysin III family)